MIRTLKKHLGVLKFLKHAGGFAAGWLAKPSGLGQAIARSSSSSQAHSWPP